MINPHGCYTLKQVCQLTTLSATTIWRRRKDGLFPQPVPLSTGRKGWPIAVIHLWLSDRAVQQLNGHEMSDGDDLL
jgi:predicted DNA-binding transcriptional regulator AlpA